MPATLEKYSSNPCSALSSRAIQRCLQGIGGSVKLICWTYGVLRRGRVSVSLCRPHRHLHACTATCLACKEQRHGACRGPRQCVKSARTSVGHGIVSSLGLETWVYARAKHSSSGWMRGRDEILRFLQVQHPARLRIRACYLRDRQVTMKARN